MTQHQDKHLNSEDYCDGLVRESVLGMARDFIKRMPKHKDGTEDMGAVWATNEHTLVGWVDEDGKVCAQFHPRLALPGRPLDPTESVSPEEFFAADVARVPEGMWAMLQVGWADGLMVADPVQAPGMLAPVIFLMGAGRCRFCGTMLTAREARDGKVHCADHEVVVRQMAAFARKAEWPPKKEGA